MRLVSALLGALTGACAFLLLRELVPRHPTVAVAAGVLVAFEPMFGFMSGSVNNDMGVNAAGAVLLLLLIRELRRGLSVPLAIGIGAAVAVAPLMKASGFELWPAAAVGLIGAVWRRRWTPALRNAGVAVAACAGVFGGWEGRSPAVHRRSGAARLGRR